MAEWRLVGEVVAIQLTDRSIGTTLLEWPLDVAGVRELRRRVSGGAVQVALAQCALDRPDRLRTVKMLVAPPSVPWLVLTGTPPGWRWGVAIEAGAAAVLPLSVRVDGLLRAIRAAAAGRPAMPSELRKRVLQDWQVGTDEQRAAALGLERLTPAETAILDLLHEGRSVREIALSTGIREATVRSHIKRLRGALGVDSQLAAVAVYRSALGLPPRRPSGE